MFEHGVTYTPHSVQQDQAQTRTIQQLVDSHQIKYIRFQWVDFTAVVRYRIIPINYFLKMLQSKRAGIAVTKAAFSIVNLHTAEGSSASGEWLIVPDLSTLRVYSFDPGHAVVLGRMEEKTPHGEEMSVAVDICPRTTLERVVEEAKSMAGVDFLVGFETEFILLKSTKPIEAVSYHAWSTSGALPAGSVQSRILSEIADSLEASDIELQMYHAEAAPGQYEIVTGPLPPLAAADALIHTRETIVNIAAKHGLRATFAPRIYLDSPGSSAHTHISVHSTTNSLPKPIHELAPVESYFLAGVLSHLQSLTAITLPIPASYKRMADGVWSGGTYVCWGTENRESPIRLANATSPTSRNFELRFLDGTCNPYLALAAIIGVGYRGIVQQRQLTMKDCTGPISAAQMSEEERQKLGITQRMSRSWEEAREKFKQDEVMTQVFGENLIKKFLSVNKILGEVLGQDTEEGLTRLVEFY